MFDYLKKLFRKNKEEMNLKSYDIVVEVNSAQGGKKREQRMNVQAPNEQMLRMMHAQTDERIVEILAVRDGDIIRDLSGNPPKEEPPHVDNTQPKTQDLPPITEPTPEPKMEIRPDFIKEPPKEKPTGEAKFYNIGGVEIKEQNGKIYQKQWIPLDIYEINNYRIVSEKNNKIISMKDKRIEVKKWVPVNTSNDNGEGTEEKITEKVLING